MSKMFKKSVKLLFNNKIIFNKKFFFSQSIETTVAKITYEVNVIDNNENYNPDYNHLMTKYKNIYTFDLCPSFSKHERKCILNQLNDHFLDRLIVFDIDHIVKNKHGILEFDHLNEKHIMGTNIKYGIKHLYFMFRTSMLPFTLPDDLKRYLDHVTKYRI